MNNNTDITEFVNKIIVEENAKAINEDDLLIASDLDSFGYAVLFLGLDEKYGCFDVKYLNNIDYETYTLNDLIKRVQECI